MQNNNSIENRSEKLLTPIEKQNTTNEERYKKEKEQYEKSIKMTIPKLSSPDLIEKANQKINDLKNEETMAKNISFPQTMNQFFMELNNI